LPLCLICGLWATQSFDFILLIAFVVRRTCSLLSWSYSGWNWSLPS
jgi:hypothetical protein